MRANDQDYPPASDMGVIGNHSIIGISARDKSINDDSNVSLLHVSEALNISMIEGNSIPKVEQTLFQRPLRGGAPEENENKTKGQIINIRTSHSRLQSKDMSLVSSQTFTDNNSKVLLLESSGIFKKDFKEQRNFEAFLPTKSLCTSLLVPKEHDRSQLETSVGGINDGQNALFKPVDVKDYASYDLEEEQDVVHSLRIKNQYRNELEDQKDARSSIDEETKELPDAGRNRRSYKRLNPQINSNEIVQIRPNRVIVNGNREEEKEEGVSELFDIQRENPISSDQVPPENNNAPAEEQNQNQTERNVRAANFEGVPVSQIQAGTNTSSELDFEVKPFLRKKIALFTVLFLSSLFLLLNLNGSFGFRGIITPFYCYCAYLELEALIGISKSRQRSEFWMKKENKLDAVSAIGYLFSLLLFDLKISDELSMGVMATVPLIIITSIYPFLSSAPDSVKISTTAIKFVLTLQTLLVTLRIDETIELDWALVLIVCLVILGVLLGYCAIYLFFIIILIFLSAFRGYRGGRLGRLVQFIGLFWYFGYYGISIAFFLILIGISQLDEPGGSPRLLILGAQIGMAINVFLVFFTLVTFKALVKFTHVHFETGGLMGNPRAQNEEERPRLTISFQVEQDKFYFIGLSSTYFIPLTRSFISRNKANLNRIKEMFRDFKFKRSSNQSATENKDLKTGKFIGLQTLKKYKEALDQKFSKLLKNQRDKPEPNSSVPKFLRIFSPKNLKSSKKNELYDKNSIADTSKSQFIKRPKFSLSVDNIDDLENVYPAQKQTTQNDEEKLCYLCYSHAPDGIVMNCGHGGFCYDCAIAAIKSKNECMECRGKVEAIYKIDMESQLRGVTKAIEIRKVIVSEIRPFPLT